MKKIYKKLMIIALFTLGIGLITGATAGIIFMQQTVAYSEYDRILTEEEIDVIDVEMSIGELILKQGDEFSIRAENIKPEEFICEISDNTWRIVEQSEEKSFTVFGWRVTDDIFDRLLSKQKPRVVITVPQNIIIGTAKLCVNSGAIEMDSLYAQNLIIQVGAGKIKADDCMVLGRLQTQIGIGCMQAEQLYAENSVIDCGIGEVVINGDIEGSMKINNTVGRTCLKIGSEINSREYNAHCIAGVIEIADLGFTGIGLDASHSVAEAEDNIDVRCGMGKIVFK